MSLTRTLYLDEHLEFGTAAQTFLAKEAAPHAEAWESAGCVSRDFWRDAARHGLVGFGVSEAYGGLGLTDFRFNAALDEAVVVAGAVGDNFMLQNDIVLPYLTALATEEQKGRWLPGFTAGDTLFAIAMSEPAAGSDLRAVTTTVEDRLDRLVLNGAKTFITSGPTADAVIVFARDKDAGGHTLLLVDASADGVTRGQPLRKIGRKAQDTSELFFSDVAVGPDAVLGIRGQALDYIKRGLPQERLAMAVTAVAAARAAWTLARDYTRSRSVFGQPLAGKQATRFTLGSLHIELEALQTYVDRCVLQHVDGALSAEDAAAVKYASTELQWRVTDAALQLHGGYGYMEEYPIARQWRDARVQRIYGGANELLLDVVGRSVIGAAP
jgi:acyl-CoA dehydrogenase